MYQYDTTWHMCLVNDTTQHPSEFKRHKTLELMNFFEKKYKKKWSCRDRGSVPLWRPMLYHCATGLTKRMLVKIKIIYRVGGILCCMVLCHMVLCCMVLCHVNWTVYSVDKIYHKFLFLESPLKIGFSYVRSNIVLFCLHSHQSFKKYIAGFC